MHWEFQMYSVTTYLTSAAQRMQQLKPPAHTNFYIHTHMLVTVCLVYEVTFDQDQREKICRNRNACLFFVPSRIKH